MEETPPQQPTEQQPPTPVAHKKKKHLPEVIAVRDWKEYLGESILIIFSVTLALILTEFFTSLHEKQQTREILHQLREELTANKKAEEEQLAYHQQVLQNIDSALRNPQFAKKVIDSGALNLAVIAPSGVMYRALNDVAWQAAKQNNIAGKINLDTYSLLTLIYYNQQLITGAEDKIASVLMSFESRKPENLRTTLLLLKDNYRGWAVDRAPGLLQLYQQAVDKLEDY